VGFFRRTFAPIIFLFMSVKTAGASHEVVLEQILSSELVKGDKDLVRKAFALLLEHKKKGDEVASPGPVLEKALILVNELNLSVDPVLAIILKEINSSGSVNEQTIEELFGKAVVNLIAGLEKIDRLDTSKFTSNAENFIRLLLTLSDDIRVILIRLGQRLFDIRHIGDLPPEKQKQAIGEASLIYVPIAHRVGLYRLKTEMEDRVMKFSEPEIYSSIEEKILATQKERDRYTTDFIKPIESRLKENGFDCEIKSRIKSVPSIHRKMMAQKVEFEKVYDLFAIRIILNNTVENEKSDCWKVYSLVTDIYTPNPRRMRDWISFPKSTGYESLHATVIGPGGRWVEVQIRTCRMDDIAEKSIAAHWKYKTGGAKGANTEFYASIREMLENPEKASSTKLANPEKRALYSDEIFIFTPQGDLKRLKAGYTVLDFAYEIHTEIGSTCTGAIVNGVMVPLKHVLNNGDTVKILTSRSQRPHRAWLDFVQSPRVIARIKHDLKMETYKEAEWGKEIIRNKVIQMGLEFNDTVLNRLIAYFSCENNLDLYQRFGEGKLDALKIKKALSEPEPKTVAAETPKEESFPQKVSEVLTGKQDFIVIDKNINSIHYQFARCCSPIPGDKIFAFVSIYHGVKIHKTNCSNARELITRYPYRILEARWKELETVKTFTANLSVTGAFDEKIVNVLTQFLVNDLKINIRSSRLQVKPGQTFSWEIGIQVGAKIQLDDVIQRLKKRKEVTNVKRVSES
jgi:GTP diphosphokinase / guanosine-3',5'-bis(diphosphate) 3'-diphosphatase